MYHEQPLFRPPADNTPLWRYMDFERFVSILERRALYFACLKDLADPFEGLPVRSHVEAARQLQPGLSEQATAKFNEKVTGFERAAQNNPANCYVSCWHTNSDESYAMWMIYAGRGAGIAIRSTFDRFKAAFQVSGPGVNAGMVKYVDFETHETLREPFLAELAFQKRRCFEFKQEFRGFLFDLEVRSAGVEIPVDINRLIERVYVSPTSTAWIVELVRAVIARYGLNVEVVQSGILSGPSYLHDSSPNP